MSSLAVGTVGLVLVAGAVVETLFADTDQVSVYHDRDGQLVATHYCHARAHAGVVAPVPGR